MTMKKIFAPFTLLLISTLSVSAQKSITGFKNTDKQLKIEADFDTVPEEYHEVFMNMMSVKYLNRVSFGDNPFSQCLPAPKHKWYQFWKKLEYKTKTV